MLFGLKLVFVDVCNGNLFLSERNAIFGASKCCLFFEKLRRTGHTVRSGFSRLFCACCWANFPLLIPLHDLLHVFQVESLLEELFINLSLILTVFLFLLQHFDDFFVLLFLFFVLVVYELYLLLDSALLSRVLQMHATGILGDQHELVGEFLTEGVHQLFEAAQLVGVLGFNFLAQRGCSVDFGVISRCCALSLLKHRELGSVIKFCLLVRFNLVLKGGYLALALLNGDLQILDVFLASFMDLIR